SDRRAGRTQACSTAAEREREQHAEAGSAPESGGGLSRVPAMGEGDADRVRGGTGARGRDARRRAARRPGGQARPSLRRAGGAHPRRRARGRGIARDKTYVTNAVKHFKWTARGKRRIHHKPNWSQGAASPPW